MSFQQDSVTYPWYNDGLEQVSSWSSDLPFWRPELAAPSLLFNAYGLIRWGFLKTQANANEPTSPSALMAEIERRINEISKIYEKMLLKISQEGITWATKVVPSLYINNHFNTLMQKTVLFKLKSCALFLTPCTFQGIFWFCKQP